MTLWGCRVNTAHLENELTRPRQALASSDTAPHRATGAQIIELQTNGSDRVLPLPGWLVKLYFIFPVVLYMPDVIFNYYVYSDGVQPQGNMVLQMASYVLWGFLSIGVVGMAYLLSVLAPWHWGQGNRVQACFCGLGVVIAVAITTWNSLAYRSDGFVKFHTDDWAYAMWPQLQANNISITMILVAIAPPFWGLFWAIVQPTETGRSLRQLQESHEERMLRMQQAAELKRLKAETNAKVREAQLRGMAATAAAARQHAAGVLSNSIQTQGPVGTTPEKHLHDIGASKDDAIRIIESSIASSMSSAESSRGVVSGNRSRVKRTKARTASAEVDGFDALVERAAAVLRARGEGVTPDAIITALAEHGYREPTHTKRVAAVTRIGEGVADRRDAAEERPTAHGVHKAEAIPSPDDKRFPTYVYHEANQLLRDGQALTLLALSNRLEQPVGVIQDAVRKLREARTAQLRPGQDLSSDPVLSNPNL